MEFVSKEQAFEAAKRLLRERNAGDLADRMELKAFENAITADPLSPQDALCAVGSFVEDETGGEATDLSRSVKLTAGDPEKGDPALWSRWIELLAAV